MAVDEIIVLIFALMSLVNLALAANPVFTVPGSPGRTIPVAETTPAGTSVYRAVAIDADNDVIVYSIASQMPATPRRFNIASTTGVITTMSEFDVDGPDSVNSYEIYVRVTDGSGNIETTLIMEITDENDNSPLFRNYHVIRENTKPGMIVTNILAEDSDSGNNGMVTYKITGGNVGGAFGIDSSSGVLYTMFSLDYDKRALYELQIEASDGGVTSRSSTMTLTLSLIESVGNNSRSNVYNKKLLASLLLVMILSLFI